MKNFYISNSFFQGNPILIQNNLNLTIENSNFFNINSSEEFIICFKTNNFLIKNLTLTQSKIKIFFKNIKTHKMKIFILKSKFNKVIFLRNLLIIDLIIDLLIQNSSFIENYSNDLILMRNSNKLKLFGIIYLKNNFLKDNKLNITLGSFILLKNIRNVSIYNLKFTQSFSNKFLSGIELLCDRDLLCEIIVQNVSFIKNSILSTKAKSVLLFLLNLKHIKIIDSIFEENLNLLENSCFKIISDQFGFLEIHNTQFLKNKAAFNIFLCQIQLKRVKFFNCTFYKNSPLNSPKVGKIIYLIFSIFTIEKSKFNENYSIMGLFEIFEIKKSNNNIFSVFNSFFSYNYNLLHGIFFFNEISFTNSFFLNNSFLKNICYGFGNIMIFKSYNIKLYDQNLFLRKNIFIENNSPYDNIMEAYQMLNKFKILIKENVFNHNKGIEKLNFIFYFYNLDNTNNIFFIKNSFKSNILDVGFAFLKKIKVEFESNYFNSGNYANWAFFRVDCDLFELINVIFINNKFSQIFMAYEKSIIYFQKCLFIDNTFEKFAFYIMNSEIIVNNTNFYYHESLKKGVIFNFMKGKYKFIKTNFIGLFSAEILFSLSNLIFLCQNCYFNKVKIGIGIVKNSVLEIFNSTLNNSNNIKSKFSILLEESIFLGNFLKINNSTSKSCQFIFNIFKGTFETKNSMILGINIAEGLFIFSFTKVYILNTIFKKNYIFGLIFKDFVYILFKNNEIVNNWKITNKICKSFFQSANSKKFNFIFEQNIIKNILSKTNDSYSLIIPIIIKTCIIGQIYNGNSNICENCPLGYFILKRFQTKCTKCDKNAKCYGKNVIIVNKGYWRSNIYTSNIYKCSQNSENCLGLFNLIFS